MKSVDLPTNANGIETDRRKRKTKALLRQTLTQLLMHKDLKDITISELTEMADVNRGTFYLHYRDIYDLFDQIEKDLLDDFTVIIAKHKQQKEVYALPAMLETFKFIAANAQLFIAILRTRETNFFAKVVEMNRPQNQDEWKKLLGDVREEYYEYYYAFITSGLYAMLKLWFSEGMPEPPEIMAKLAEKMMENSVRSLSKKS